MRINYVLKVRDAKLGVLRKALTQAGIDVVSLVEVFREEDAPPPVSGSGTSESLPGEDGTRAGKPADGANG